MVECGAEHLKGLCVVAARLAKRAWTVMARGMPYVHTVVTPEQAKKIIAERYTVTERKYAAGVAAPRPGGSPSTRPHGT